MICLFAPQTQAAPESAASPDPFEPTVTRKESDLLQQAMTLAERDLPAAIALLRDQNLDTASPALHYALGNLYVQTNRLADAEAAYRDAITKLPRFRSALNNLARVYLMQDKPRQAITVFGELVRDGQGDADVLTLYGHACTLAGQPLSAETAYRQALLLRPADTEARHGLAKCLIDQQRYAEALAIVKELLGQKPNNADLWSLRANVELTLDQPDTALASLETARRLNAVTPDMLATLGDLYLNRQQAADAVAAYTAAFAATNAPVARQLRAAEGLLNAGQLEQAEQLLDHVDTASLDPEQTRRHLRLRAEAARLGGRIEEAHAALRDLIRRDPLDGASLLALGDLDRESGKLEEARLSYERAARIRGFEARALVRQAQVEVDRERYPTAVELLQAAQAFEDQPHVARYLEQVRRMVR